MTPDNIFSIASIGAMAGWVLLVLAPLRREAIILAARAVGVALAVLYAGLIIGAMTSSDGLGADFGKLSSLAAAFSHPPVMLIGWIHYLAFDLWVGAWEAEVAPKWGIPHWALIPCLGLTFSFGPMGLLVFLIVAGVFRLLRKA